MIDTTQERGHEKVLMQFTFKYKELHTKEWGLFVNKNTTYLNAIKEFYAYMYDMEISIFPNSVDIIIIELKPVQK